MVYFSTASTVDISAAAPETRLLGFAREDDTVVLGLEPLHSILLGQTVGETNLANLSTRTD